MSQMLSLKLGPRIRKIFPVQSHEYHISEARIGHIVPGMLIQYALRLLPARTVFGHGRICRPRLPELSEKSNLVLGVVGFGIVNQPFHQGIPRQIPLECGGCGVGDFTGMVNI